jgi:hypothetical protein
MDRNSARALKRARRLRIETPSTALGDFLGPVATGLPPVISWSVAAVSLIIALTDGNPLAALLVTAPATGLPFLGYFFWRRHQRAAAVVTSTARDLARNAATNLEALLALPPSAERDSLVEVSVGLIEEVVNSGPVLREALEHDPSLVRERHHALQAVVTELSAATGDLQAAEKLNRQVLVLKQDLEATDERISRLKSAATSARTDSATRLDSTTAALAELEGISSLEVRPASPDRAPGTLARGREL